MYNGIYSGNSLNSHIFNHEQVIQMQRSEQLRQLQELIKKELNEEQMKTVAELIRKETNVNAIRNRTIREFADKLKKISLITENDIERIAKEMMEGENKE